MIRMYHRPPRLERWSIFECIKEDDDEMDVSRNEIIQNKAIMGIAKVGRGKGRLKN